MSFYGWNIYLERKNVEKQIANIFFLLSFNYLMIKSWGTWKVTLLTVIGNYFLISILILRKPYNNEVHNIPFSVSGKSVRERL
mgnify:CR=1 FL=1